MHTSLSLETKVGLGCGLPTDRTHSLPSGSGESEVNMTVGASEPLLQKQAGSLEPPRGENRSHVLPCRVSFIHRATKNNNKQTLFLARSRATRKRGAYTPHIACDVAQHGLCEMHASHVLPLLTFYTPALPAGAEEKVSASRLMRGPGVTE